jgi:putative transposase
MNLIVFFRFLPQPFLVFPWTPFGFTQFLEVLPSGYLIFPQANDVFFVQKIEQKTGLRRLWVSNSYFGRKVRLSSPCDSPAPYPKLPKMKIIFLLFASFLTTLAQLLSPGGIKTVLAENLLLRQQLLVLTRARQRAPNLSPTHRVLMGFWSLLLNPRRLIKSAVCIRPSTLLKFRQCLIRRKYQRLFSSQKRTKPGPKGPFTALIRAIVELKRRNPRFGCPRIALIISRTFGITIHKHLVRRVLFKDTAPESNCGGPSWLTFLGQMKDSLWSVDLFRCESITLKSHWVLVVMDQFTRRLIGFRVQPEVVDGQALCHMFNTTIDGKKPPRYLSSDHDPLFTFHRWQANLRILEVREIKSIPTVPLSHPFIERVIGTIRREFLDHQMFWNARDL